MKKENKVIRNIKYFVPLLFKTSPITILIIILNALLSSLNSFICILIPAKIIEEMIENKNLNNLILYVGILGFSVFFIKNLKTFFSAITNNSALKTDFLINNMINNKIMEVDYFNIEDPNFIDSIHRAKRGMSNYTNGIFTLIYSLEIIIETFVSIIGVIGIIIFSKQYLIIIVALIGIIINIFIYQKVQIKDQKFRNETVRINRKTQYYNFSITNFRLQKDLRLFNGKQLVLNAAEEHNNESHKKSMKQAKKLNFLYFIDITSNYYISQLITLSILGYMYFLPGNLLTIATFTMLYSSIRVLQNSSANLIFSFQKYLKACDYQNEFINLMEVKSVFKNGNLSIDKIEKIEFKNVSFKYPRTEKLILDNISFVLNNKEKISLVGLNGAGKTTIIKLLCRFFEVNEGEILVNGINIINYDYKQYMKLMAIVFQDYKIISFSIKSNVAIIDENREKLYDCFKRAQVYDKVIGLEKKEYTYVNKWFDKNGVEFSGGELQKFAISRALYKNCDFIVLDEPTSALDPLAEAEIYYHFNDIIGKKLTLFISHRLSSCIFSDRIIVIDGSKIVEEGTHKELMRNNDGLYSKMFTAQSEYYK